VLTSVQDQNIVLKRVRDAPKARGWEINSRLGVLGARGLAARLAAASHFECGIWGLKSGRKSCVVS
jgi:hypothetical protein